MEDVLEIPVHYNGKDLLIPAKLVQHGYTHRLLITVNDIEMYLEPDEERNYRAFLMNPDEAANAKVDKELVRAIIEVLQNL